MGATKAAQTASRQRTRPVRSSLRDRAFIVGVYSVICVIAFICFLPFWAIVVNSFASESSLSANGYQLWPAAFSLDAYRFMFASDQLYRSYRVTATVTTLGSVLAVLITTMYAYAISHYRVRYRNVISFMTYLTMIFGSGLVGFYLTVARDLHLKDSVWALILPYLLNPFYTLILMGFFRQLPRELHEAAIIDGANDIHVFFRIIWPLSLPVIATVTLFYALQYWNDWWLALLFIDIERMHPLQMMIRRLISTLNATNYLGGSGFRIGVVVPNEGLQLTIVCLTIGPIILVYPFVQKYFVKGITLGAVKG
jgi:putative aldouronate transport system permease protein